MKTRPFRSLRRLFVSGFTLIETLIVMVVLGIAAVTIASLTGNLFVGQAANRDIVVGTQLMQECAERLLAKGGVNYSDACLVDSAAATTCCSVSGYSAPTVTITLVNSTNANLEPCPFTTGNNCKLVSITQGGLSPITLMLIKH